MFGICAVGVLDTINDYDFAGDVHTRIAWLFLGGMGSPPSVTRILPAGHIMRLFAVGSKLVASCCLVCVTTRAVELPLVLLLNA